MEELANRSEATRTKYSDFFKDFSEFAGQSPDEMIAQRKIDFKADDPIKQNRYESLLKRFIAHLNDQGRSVATLQVGYASVRSFFDAHYMPLRMRRSDYPRGESLGLRAATKDDVRLLLDKTRLKVRAIILFLKDSGLRVSDLVKLKYKDIRKELENDSDFISLNLVTTKNSIVAQTFIGPETVNVLKKYMERRRKGTRRIPAEEITDESPLFRARKIEVAHISRSGVSSLITHHIERLGMHKEISAHSLRKYFQTQLEAAGVHPNWIEGMMGHKLNGVTNHYSRPTQEQLKEAYKEAYPSLRVTYEENDVQELAKTSQELQKQLLDQQEQIQKLERIIEKYVPTEDDMYRDIALESSEIQFKKPKD